MKKNLITRSFSETRNLGKNMAQRCLKIACASKTGAFIIGLKGDLGGGKTTFVQGFAKGLGIKEKVLSPTFVILKKFPIPKKLRIAHFGFQDFYHIDCYRIQKPNEILRLDFKEIISDSKNIVIIEWSDKIKKILPKNTKFINFIFINRNTRKIEIIDK